MGQEKASMHCVGIPLLERVKQQCQFKGSPFEPIYVLGGASSAFAPYQEQWLADQYPGEGPLGALLSACQSLSEPGWFLLASCDTLNIKPQELLSLSASCSESLTAIAYKNTYWETLWALYHTDIYPRAMRIFQSGERSLQALLAQTEALALDSQALDWWQINRPVDLKRAETLIKGQYGELRP